MTDSGEWTTADLDLLRVLKNEGASIEDMAKRLGRTVTDVADRLTLLRPPTLPSSGTDEEGDVPPPDGGRIDDPAAWVHEDPLD